MGNTKDFKATLPVSLSAGTDGEWRVVGLASTEDLDQQGERVSLAGLDLTPIDEGRGKLNLDHSGELTDLLGVINSYKKTSRGLMIEGTLFKDSEKAKAVYQVLSAVKGTKNRPIGLSIEGKIKERAGENGHIIKEAEIDACAITLSPVNSATWLSLAKSFAGVSKLAFTTNKLTAGAPTTGVQREHEVRRATFSADQVVALAKALSADSGYADKLPQQLSGGDALSQEDLKKEPAKVTFEEKEEKCMKCGELHQEECLKKNEDSPDYEPLVSPLAKAFSKKLNSVMKQLKILYPEQDEKLLWKVFSARMNAKFPGLGME